LLAEATADAAIDSPSCTRSYSPLCRKMATLWPSGCIRVEYPFGRSGTTSSFDRRLPCFDRAPLLGRLQIQAAVRVVLCHGGRSLDRRPPRASGTNHV